MDSVCLAGSRPIRFFTRQESSAPREGDDVFLFLLVMKRVGDIIALPKDGANFPTQVKGIRWHFAAEDGLLPDYKRDRDLYD